MDGKPADLRLTFFCLILNKNPIIAVLLSMKKRLFITALFLLGAFTSVSFAQSDTTKSYTEGVFFLGGVGPAIPLGDFGDERESGFDFNTALDFRLSKHFFVRGMFDFSSFKFKTGAITQTIGGTDYSVGGTNNLISLLVSGGYYLPLGRITPYAFTGIGASFVSRPDVSLDLGQNVIDIQTQIDPHFSQVFGAGVDFILNPPTAESKPGTLYFLYFETFYTHIPGTTNISANKFNLLTFNIGIKTSF